MTSIGKHLLVNLIWKCMKVQLGSNVESYSELLALMPRLLESNAFPSSWKDFKHTPT